MPDPVLSEAPPSMEVTLTVSFCLRQQIAERVVTFRIMIITIISMMAMLNI